MEFFSKIITQNLISFFIIAPASEVSTVVAFVILMANSRISTRSVFVLVEFYSNYLQLNIAIYLKVI